jgi:hypothetical protein
MWDDLRQVLCARGDRLTDDAACWAARGKDSVSVFVFADHFPCMDTIKDIFDFCEARAGYGEPVVPNWAQVRGNLLSLAQYVPLGEIALNSFGAILPPDRCKSCVPEVRRIDARIYKTIRREVVRILGLAGDAEDEWEAFRGFLRSAGETTTERVLYLLKSKAEEAGLRPKDVSRDWALQVFSSLESDAKRQTFRAAIRGVDKLIKDEGFAGHHLLPAHPVGPLTNLDKQGRERLRLPESLIAIEGHLGEVHINAVWRAAVTCGQFSLEEQPALIDFFTGGAWERISSVSHDHLGLKERSWQVYKLRFIKDAKNHLPASIFKTVPSFLVELAKSDVQRLGLTELWRRVRGGDLQFDTLDGALALLSPPVWRQVWSPSRGSKADFRFNRLECAARQALVDAGGHDPRQAVLVEWMKLPVEWRLRAIDLRIWAVRHLLAPNEVTASYLEGASFGPAGLQSAQDLLTCLGQDLTATQSKEVPAHVEAWDVLVAELRRNSNPTTGMKVLRPLAEADGLCPTSISPDWVSRKAAEMSSRCRTQLKVVLGTLDRLLSSAQFDRLLYPAPIGTLRDARKGGLLSLPLHLVRELEAYTGQYGFARNTFRSLRTVLTHGATAASDCGHDVEQMNLKSLCEFIVTTARAGRGRADAMRILERLQAGQGAARPTELMARLKTAPEFSG